MTKGLSSEQINRYRREGYVYPLQALSSAEAASYMRGLEAMEKRGGPDVLKTLRGKAHLLSTSLYKLMSHPRILDHVESIIGPDILVWNSSLFLKEPHDPAFVQWHQDVYEFDNTSDYVVSAWVALLPSTVPNGAMRVVPGSFKNRLVEHTQIAPGTAAMIRDNMEIGVDVDEASAVDIVLEAGEMSLHHMYTFHGSPPNRSDHRRCGFAIRYVAPDVAKRNSPYAATVVRGQDRFGYFQNDPVPSTDLDPEMIEYVKHYGKPKLPAR